MPVLLELQDLTINFGGLVAVDQVNLQLEEGQVVALIGPNGAGKSTVFNVITGIYPPTGGKVLFKGQDITHMKTYDITSLGIAGPSRISGFSRTFPSWTMYGSAATAAAMQVFLALCPGCRESKVKKKRFWIKL